MHKYAIIVAGGSGTRMGSILPKQFMLLLDKPVLFYTLDAFLSSYSDLQIILVLPDAYTDMGAEIIDAYFDHSRITITAGGETRFDSVKNGLRLVNNDSIVFVHDGVRCLVTTDLIKRCYEHALENGSAIPVVPAQDSVRISTGDDNEAIERTKVMMVQTPQTFHSRILLPAYEIDFKERFTDEATVVEAYGLKIKILQGEETNIKITRPTDLIIAERIIQERQLQDSY